MQIFGIPNIFPCFNQMLIYYRNKRQLKWCDRIQIYRKYLKIQETGLQSPPERNGTRFGVIDTQFFYPPPSPLSLSIANIKSCALQQISFYKQKCQALQIIAFKYVVQMTQPIHITFFAIIYLTPNMAKIQQLNFEKYWRKTRFKIVLPFQFKKIAYYL